MQHALEPTTGARLIHKRGPEGIEVCGNEGDVLNAGSQVGADGPSGAVLGLEDVVARQWTFR